MKQAAAPGGANQQAAAAAAGGQNADNALMPIARTAAGILGFLGNNRPTGINAILATKVTWMSLMRQASPSVPWPIT